MAALGARVAEGAATAANVKSSLPKKVRVKSGSAATYRPVVTTVTVVMGMGLLKNWLVDHGTVPDRKWWVNMAILGFVLSLMVEVAPKAGKNMSYLILTAVGFAQSIPILDELEGKKTARDKTPNDQSPIEPITGGRRRA